jgi:serine/threonine protein kinase
MPVCSKCKHEVAADAKFCGNCAAPMPQTTNLVGKCINNKYIVTKRIAEGGMGEVYLARQQGIDQEVAIKKLHRDLCSNQKLVDRFITEAKSYGKISHPNAVKVHDLLNVNGELCIVMEYVKGKTLTSYIESGYEFSQNQVIHIALQVADALATAHDAGIIHRDLKTENIMLLETVSGRFSAKILDFGIAKVADAPTDGQTCQGTILGTPEFMSPEQCCGKSIDGRSDIYSFGIILYVMLSGRLPFLSESKVGVIGQQLNCFPPTLRRKDGKTVSPELEYVTMKCLRKEPKDRYQRFADVIQDLELIQEGKAPVFASAEDVIISSDDPMAELEKVSRSLSLHSEEQSGDKVDVSNVSEENEKIALGSVDVVDDTASSEQFSRVELGTVPEPSVFAPALEIGDSVSEHSKEEPKVTKPEASNTEKHEEAEDGLDDARIYEKKQTSKLTLSDTTSTASMDGLKLGDAEIDDEEDDDDESKSKGGIGKVIAIVIVLLLLACGYIFASQQTELPGSGQIRAFLTAHGIAFNADSDSDAPDELPAVDAASSEDTKDTAETPVEQAVVEEPVAVAEAPTLAVQLPDMPESKAVSRDNIMRGVWRTSLDASLDTLNAGKLEDALAQLENVKKNKVGFTAADQARLDGYFDTYKAFKAIYDSALRAQKNFECGSIRKNADKLPEAAKGFKAQIDKMYRKCNSAAESAPTTL